MEKKDLGGMLKGKLKMASYTVKNTVKDAQIPDVKLPEIKIPDVKMPDQMKNILKKSNNRKAPEGEAKTESSKGHIQEGTNGLEQKENEFSEREIQTVSVISPINAVKVFYYMMAVDGSIEEKEEEKFILIGKKLDPSFD
ncbi:MAG: hypothetical protein K6G84_15830 [Lachnospiraceae bacterium]|nr:hypothetical protein [Lachnospiraceae bacterium]